MPTIVSNHILASEVEENIKTKTYGLGTEEVDTSIESNLDGVEKCISAYINSSSILKEYKIQLDIDVNRINQLGIKFFELDHDCIKF